jgi:O-antigen ligase
MNKHDILYMLLTFLSAVGALVGVALILHWGRNRDTGLLPYVFYPIYLVVALSIWLSGRSLYVADEINSIITVQHPLAIWLGRATSIFVLFAAGERIVSRLVKTQHKHEAPKLLIFAFLIYVLTNFLSPALFGAHVFLTHDPIYMVLAGCAALLCTKQEGETAVQSIRNALLIFVILSAIALLWQPDMVIERGYQGLIPGLSIRYAGLSMHANSFGAIVVVFLICLREKPFTVVWLNRFAWIIGCTSLLLTQSKTNWISFLLCMPSLAYYSNADYMKRISDFRRPCLSVVILASVMLFSCAVIMVLMFGNVGDRMHAFFSTSEGANLLSLTGRDQIWEAALQEWHRHPIFGYGLTIWDEEYRLKVAMITSATHAHNQLYQSLSSAGLVGATGLVIYVSILFGYVMKTARPSHGLSVALFLLIIFRSFTEVPLSMKGFAGDQMTHLILLIVVASNIVPRVTKNRSTKLSMEKNLVRTFERR